MKFLKLLMVLVAPMLWASPVTADTIAVRNAEIVRTLVADAGRFGGCMARLDQDLAALGLSCPSGWVTFSCSGVFTSKDVAYRMFDSALMAFALGYRVTVLVDDAKKHNGYCYADRIDVFP